MPQNAPPDDDATTDGYRRRTVLTGTGSLAPLGLVGSSGLASATPGRDPGPKKDELIVGISRSVADVERAARAAVPGDAEIVHTNDRISYAAVSFPSSAADRGREEFIEAVTKSDDVEYVEANATLEALDDPDDPHYDIQYAPQQVNCEDAWETTYGSDDVVVAVVDSGVQYDHPNLEGTVDDRIGEDFVGTGSDPSPSSGDDQHGTHVAGIAAGETDNGTGTAGISNCSLLAARALDEDGRGSLADIADAIQWAADAGADVINLSLGARDGYDTLQRACEYALEADALLVGAAGNDGSDAVFYPAAYEDVLAVSALESDESLASYSNTGPEIDLAAPGTSVASTVPWNGYAYMSGTSIAAPVVAGVAGLALSAHPDLSATELREHLAETAVDLGLHETAQGDGRVDAARAVETDPFPEDDSTDEDDEGDESEEENGECGDQTVTASGEGHLSGGWWGESDRYSYPLRTDDPCSATVTLEGPRGADFDLYVTLDGRSPTRWDHDAASSGSGADEELDLELEFDGDEELGLQVHADSGSGEYVLRIEEQGQ